MEEQSPIEIIGTQVLQSGEPGKIAITVGDGGLFNQPLQNITNAEKGINYGACDSRMSVINTPEGTVWVNQRSGHIFIHTGDNAAKYHNRGQIEEISNQGMHFWIHKYLPSQLASQFPDYPYLDNPVMGVGVQCMFDEMFDILYICKKDFKAKDGVTWNGKEWTLGTATSPCPTGYNWISTPTMACACQSAHNPKIILPCTGFITFGDPNYFEDCSWTLSYHMSSKTFISFHNWFPDYSISTRRHNMTTKQNALWVHNDTNALFSQFYGVSYPTEVAFHINTTPEVTTLRNVEYYLEAYQYTSNQYDRFQQYDFNFSQIMIYNADQCSGLINLVRKSGNPYEDLQYPIIGSSYITSTYSVKEHKYRINQFFDLTNDRGEYSASIQQMFNTPGNGVDYVLNPLYFNYEKDPLQLKKFRNYNNTIFFRTFSPGAIQQQIRISASGYQNSPR